MTISADTQKSFDNIQHPFMIKIFKELAIKANFLNLIKGIYKIYKAKRKKKKKEK